MICPRCGARNTDQAPWCTQCLAALGEPETPEASAPQPGQPAPDAGDVSTTAPSAIAEAGEQSPAAGEPVGVDDRRVRNVDGALEWRCPTCDTWHPFDLVTCTVCGGQLGAAVVGIDRQGRAARVAQLRQRLWLGAAVAGVLLVAGIILLVMAVRAGSGG